MDRSTQISQIIAKRQSKAALLKTLKPKWQKLQAELRSLQSQIVQLQTQPAIAPHIKDLDFTATIATVDQRLSVIDDLEQRLMRDHLSIGVVGQMGQGKSRLLQSMTGLADDAIPTGSAGVCTSALSKIFQVAAPPEHAAEVEFYDWTAFRDDVLFPYYDNLGLTPKPNTMEDFAAGVPPLPPEMRQERTIRIYGRFRREYWNEFGKYRQQLTGKTLKLKSLQDLRRYLVHNRDAETRLSWDDLCVREIRIFHQFGDALANNIAVMDSPGYGDNNAYDVKRLIRALKRDIDFILFIRMVDGVAFRWSKLDEELMGVVSDALGDFPIEACSYLIGNSPKAVPQESADNQFAILKKHVQSHTKVQDAMRIDCADPEAVQQQVMLPVLNYLEQNIESIYDRYLDAYERDLRSLHSKITAQLNQALTALDTYGSTEDLAFNPWFDYTLWPELAVGMQKEIQGLDRKRYQDDTDFEKEIQNVMTRAKADAVIPSEAEIEQFRSENKGSYKIAYYIAINEIGEQLLRDIGTLNYVIQTVLDNAKREIAATLMRTTNIHLLDSSLPTSAPELCMQLSTRYLQDFPILREAFADLGEHQVSFANMIGSWVRHNLDELTPDRNVDPLSRQTLNPSSDSVSLTEVQTIRQALESSRDRVIQSCHETLKQKLKEPNYFAYEMVKKFSDRILSKPAQTQWRNFLGRHKLQVCPDCQDSAQRVAAKEQWRSQVSAVLGAAAALDRI